MEVWRLEGWRGGGEGGVAGLNVFYVKTLVVNRQTLNMSPFTSRSATAASRSATGAGGMRPSGVGWGWWSGVPSLPPSNWEEAPLRGPSLGSNTSTKLD